jgi:bleomycin hydrolase
MKNLFSLVVFVLFFSAVTHSQENGYNFVMKREVPSTPVKNQSVTSTCWSFSGISFFESEILRVGKKPYDLSEMYIVNEAYRKKADEYARRNGGCALSGGGQYNDLLYVSREDGLVPDEVYPGLVHGEKNHNHDELDAALKGFMSGVIKSTRHTNAWHEGLNGILEAYLGKTSAGFQYDGEYYTPQTFARALGINFDDYLIFSSFSDHPFYKEAVLEVPDNWAPCTYFNLPLNELMQVIDNALMNGYSIAWACDMRGRGFSMKKGVAIVPEKDWNEISDDEAEELFNSPHPQMEITQEIRQKAFENYEITGDHGMHIIGMATDQKGNIFYKVKNSWGTTGKYQGYIYVSRQFVELKTTNCMINKNAIPVTIAQKMGITTNQFPNGAIAEGKTDETEKSSVPAIQQGFPMTQ